MKQILTAFFLLASVIASASDLIIKHNEEKLEVKIIEVSETDVRYKMLDNLEGPTFLLKSDKIAAIIFENGFIKTFSKEQEVSNTLPSEKPKLNSLVIRNGNTYTYEGQVMNKIEYRDFLKENCPIAYDKMNRGYTSAYTGWCLLGAGLGIDLGTIIVGAATGNLHYNALNVMSAVFEIVSIPMLITGYVQMHKSVNIFNEQCTNANMVSLELQASANGVGLALHF